MSYVRKQLTHDHVHTSTQLLLVKVNHNLSGNSLSTVRKQRFDSRELAMTVLSSSGAHTSVLQDMDFTGSNEVPPGT